MRGAFFPLRHGSDEAGFWGRLVSFFCDLLMRRNNFDAGLSVRISVASSVDFSHGSGSCFDEHQSLASSFKEAEAETTEEAKSAGGKRIKRKELFVRFFFPASFSENLKNISTK